MTEPTEAEVEAAAVAVKGRSIERGLDLLAAECRSLARAALTAAAQVRERAKSGDENRIASPGQEAALAGYVESVARALHEAHQPYCDYTYPFDNPMSSSDMYRALARAVTLVRGPTLMPIYDSTEPDQGPDVLGLRKGEE